VLIGRHETWNGLVVGGSAAFRMIPRSSNVCFKDLGFDQRYLCLYAVVLFSYLSLRSVKTPRWLQSR